MIIYKATNILNGKCYIGKSEKSLDERKAAHRWNALNNGRGYRSKFYNAIRKYGFENFSWEILESNINNKNDLIAKEISYIEKFQTITNGYNISVGGLGGDNFTHHPLKEEIRSKISQSCTGKKRSKEFKIWNRIRQIGKIVRQETKDKISKANKGKIISLEQREQIRQTLLGRIMPEDVKNKISKTATGKKFSEEHRRKIGDAKRGKKYPFKNLTLNHRKKIGQALKGRVFSEEWRAKLKAAWQKRKHEQ